jgi:hypothetical protein
VSHGRNRNKNLNTCRKNRAGANKRSMTCAHDVVPTISPSEAYETKPMRMTQTASKIPYGRAGQPGAASGCHKFWYSICMPRIEYVNDDSAYVEHGL